MNLRDNFVMWDKQDKYKDKFVKKPKKDEAKGLTTKNKDAAVSFFKDKKEDENQERKTYDASDFYAINEEEEDDGHI